LYNGIFDRFPRVRYCLPRRRHRMAAVYCSSVCTRRTKPIFSTFRTVSMAIREGEDPSRYVKKTHR
jgi:hypothetical protein